jgi:hypothetical protein
MNEWIECSVCESEYKIVAVQPADDIRYCPFCGTEIELEDTDEEEDEDLIDEEE